MPSHLKDFIVVEEDDGHFDSFRTAFDSLEIESRSTRVQNPAELLVLLDQPDHSGFSLFNPRLIFLGMPRDSKPMWGFLEMRKLRIDLKRIPLVVIANTEIESVEAQKLYDYGVNSLVLRPKSQADYDRLIVTMGQYWFGVVMLPSVE